MAFIDNSLLMVFSAFTKRNITCYLLLTTWYLVIFTLSSNVFAQTKHELNDLTGFQNPSYIWYLSENVVANPFEGSLKANIGKGVLVSRTPNNLNESKDNLQTVWEHGDVKVSLDFMLPRNGRSGIYLMGRYKIDLIDSWGQPSASLKNCGSIAQRWNDSLKIGYDGHLPRQNVCKAPGIWQHLEVAFQAPQFDSTGHKMVNARMIKVVLNGVLIHENVELSGPNKGAMANDEKPLAPLMLEGNQGAVAFRNIQYEKIDKNLVSLLTPVSYEYYEGKFGSKVPVDFPIVPQIKGTCEAIDCQLAEKNSDFLLQFIGKINIPEEDVYQFIFHCRGYGKLLIDGQVLVENYNGWDRETAAKQLLKLTTGEHTFQAFYTKDFPWGSKELGLYVSRIGMNPVALHTYKSLPNPEPVSEISLNPTEHSPLLQRSFVMHKGIKRTHAINVGSNTGIHYAYDLSQATLLYAWKGNYLNTTDMWHERGEAQLAQPLGAVQVFSGKTMLAYLSDLEAPMPDSLNDEKELRYKGYHVSMPVFTYQYRHLTYQMVISPVKKVEGGRTTERLVVSYSFAENSNLEKIYCRVATGTHIEEVANHLYIIDGQYFVQVPVQAEVFIRGIGNNTEILMKASPDENGIVKYALIW
jgi:Domain of Unknown Function (DUF1080)